MKKVIFLLIVFVLIIFMTSCGILPGFEHAYYLDEELHNVIKRVPMEENDHPNKASCIIYQGEKYYRDTECYFQISANNDPDPSIYKVDKNDILLSWNQHRYFGYIDEFYSDTTESPVFIYSVSNVSNRYFHEDYDPMSDIFVVEETGEEIVYKDICKFELGYIVTDFNISKNNIFLRSKQYPRIYARVDLFQTVGGKWYMQLACRHTEFRLYEASDEFLTILKQNGLLDDKNE